MEGPVIDETLKKHLNIVFIGHVDAGKSSLCGQILVKTGAIDPRTIEKLHAEAEKCGKTSWYLSWIMDLGDTERLKGNTEELGVAHFESSVYKFTILDAPGHRNYVPQMIGGTLQADVAVLVVSARTGEFEAGFEKAGQTPEHLIIAKTAGVRFIIIAVNKMDDPTVNWSEKRYNEIVQKLAKFMAREVGYKENQFISIPIAAQTGLNLIERYPQATWYTGPTFFEALDKTPLPPRNEKDVFILPVYDRYKSKFVYAHGKIEKGVIAEGSQVIVMPSGVKGTVSGISVEEVKIRRGVPGDNVRLALNGISLEAIQAGSVICQNDQKCHVADKALVKLRFVSNAPDVMTLGFVSVCHIHNEVVSATIENIVQTVDLQKKVEKRPKFIKPNMLATCILKFEKNICVEPFSEFPQLGRFLLRHEGWTIAIGLVEKLPKTS